MNLIKNYNWLIFIFVIWPILDLILNLININLPVIRYVVYTLGTYYIIQLYLSSNRNLKYLSVFNRLVLTFALTWLVIRFLLSISDVFNPQTNYIAFKNAISGQFLLFFSFFLVNVPVPLKYLKMLLKISYILMIIFLIVGVPLFGFFVASIENKAELFVRYFSVGGMFLLLLFPYQKVRLNVIVTLGLIISLLMMLIIARRNLVLYISASIFLLSLVILFSQSVIIQKRRPLLVAGAIIVGLLSLVFVIAMQFNFDLFIERADTGFDSRQSVVVDFIADFNSKPLDWYTGRGLYGTYFSSVELDGTNYRNLIENGYFHYILKNGLLFLIPFLLLSIIAAVNGFFRSKNHLSKAAAILIVVNLIDMVGYGLPFLGLKYLNLLIAFGFCFTPTIRNMDDLEIRKIIRL